MADLTVDIVTPEKIVFSGPASEVRVPGWNGEFGDKDAGRAARFGPQCHVSSTILWFCFSNFSVEMPGSWPPIAEGFF